MAQPPSAARADTGPGAEDELDDLYDYGAGMADAFREVDTNMEVAPRGGGAQRAQDEKGAKRKRATLADDLGIDEEVRVKTRAPRFKLDDNLLLSEKGIPKLRQSAKKQLRFKGKGHEFSDVARLLAFYQLWLDDMYPKAKFADGLAIIEKLGHSRRIQVMRKQWIDEARGHGADQGDASHENERSMQVPGQGQGTSVTASRENNREATPARPEEEEVEDIYSATPRAQRIGHGATARQDGPEATTNQAPEEDELDAILAAAMSSSNVPKPQQKDNGRDGAIEIPSDPEDDDLDALLAEEAARPRSTATGHTPREPQKAVDANEASFDDDMEAMNELDGPW